MTLLFLLMKSAKALETFHFLRQQMAKTDARRTSA